MMTGAWVPDIVDRVVTDGSGMCVRGDSGIRQLGNSGVGQVDNDGSVDRQVWDTCDRWGNNSGDVLVGEG